MLKQLMRLTVVVVLSVLFLIGISTGLVQAREERDPQRVAASTVTVTIQPVVQQVALGLPFTIAVAISNVQNLGGFQFDLVYNPAQVQVNGASLGSLLGSTGRTLSVLGPQIDNTTGRTRYGAFSFGAQPGPDGAGTLAVLTMTAPLTTTAVFTLENVHVSDVTGNAQTTTVQGGSVIVEYWAPPTAEFATSNPDWLGQTTLLTSTVTGHEPIAYRWTFGDGGTSNAPNPNHVYSSPGVYMVMMTATNAVGVGTASHPITVFSVPTASFTSSTPDWLGQTTFFTNSTGTTPAGDSTVTYQWSFGDGVISTLANPTHVYAAAGNYTVWLTATNAAGSIAISSTAVIYSAPAAGFTSTSPDWLGQTSIVTNTSTTTPSGDSSVTYQWTFGDGAAASSLSASHLYTSAGIYIVVLTATNPAGQSVVTNTLTVYGAPVTDFQTSTPNWLGQTTAFTNATATTPAGDATIAYQWAFGDGTGSALTNPTHAYAAAGNYTVILTATNAAGQHVKSTLITIYSAPAVSFATSSPDWLGQSTTFTNTTVTTPVGDPSVNYQWSFGDGVTSTLSSPSHAYLIAGTYTVWLTATNAAGSTALSNTVAIYGAPTASFSSSAPDWLGQTSVFTSTSTTLPVGDPSVSYQWAFGDGGMAVGSTANHVYATPGIYTILLTVTNPAGQSVATSTLTIYSAPQADFQTSTPDWLGQTTVFTNATTITPPGDVTVEYQWSFGDGSVSTLPNPIHSYLIPGTYTAILTATNAAGQRAKSLTVTVYGIPNTSFTTSSPDWLGQTTVFMNTTDSIPSGDSTFTYQWSFGDGGTSTLANPTHAYAAAGTYTVWLTATNAAGSVAVSDTVMIYSAPVASFTTSDPDWLGQASVFTNTSTTTPANDSSVTYEWGFGDGGTADGLTASHLYVSQGMYTIVLTATNLAGQSVATNTLAIYSAPVADFQTSTPDWLGQTTTFSNTTATSPSGDSTIAYQWSFGDGTGGTLVSPTHAYATAGSYTVILTATNAAGSQSISKTVVIYGVPVAGFSVGSPNWLGQTTTFTNTTSSEPVGDPTVTYQWSFGDGSTSANLHPTHQYAVPGLYQAVLTATNAAGQHVIMHPVIIYSAPVANFTSTSPDWLGQTTAFVNATDTLPAGDSSIVYQWTFGDGLTSTLAAPTHVYSASGGYTVSLTAANLAGSSSITRSVTIYGAPTVYFATTSPDWLGESTGFAATVSVDPPDDPSITLTWDFGDGVVRAGLAYITHTYSASGVYTPVLTVTNSAGSITATNTVVVNGPPIANFDSTSPDWLGQTTWFTNTTTGPGPIGYQWAFGEGAVSMQDTPTHTYSAPGVYSVVLTATNLAGNTFVTRAITIYSAPAASFALTPSTGVRPLSVVFSNTSTTLPPNDPSVQYVWQFGDGALSNSINPTHAYTSAGIYTVTLSASNLAGVSVVSQTRVVTVYEPVSAGFSAVPISGTFPLTVTFINTSTGDYTTSLWNFGDGVTGTATNPVHVYQTRGSYTVTLSVSGPGGSSELAQPNVIAVYIPVSAEFSATPISGTRPMTVSFANQSLGDFTSSTWNFGDGMTSAMLNPQHTYTTTGVYTVSLRISGLGGTSILTRTNYLTVAEAAPVAAFTASPLFGQRPLLVAFTDQSTGAITQWFWQFGDGLTSTMQNPTHTYQISNSFGVTLTVTGPGGFDKLIKSNYIRVGSEYKVYLPLLLK
jgi:PKD repeat protein